MQPHVASAVSVHAPTSSWLGPAQAAQAVQGEAPVADQVAPAVHASGEQVAPTWA